MEISVSKKTGFLTEANGSMNEMEDCGEKGHVKWL
jgi:hypothetical protein